MFASTHSVIFHQLEAQKITIQVSTQQGVPKMVLTGMASRVVEESKDRIIASLKFHKIKFKSCRTVINLMPTELMKNDNHLELAILVGVLASYGLVEVKNDDCFIGSLGLQGEILNVPAIFALTLSAKELGFSRIFVSAQNFEELKIISGVKIIKLDNIKQLISNTFSWAFTEVGKYSVQYHKTSHSIQEIVGNESAIRALQIAAAGHHHLLLTGPPGYGKTLMANCLQALLAPLSFEQTLTVTKNYSLAGIKRELSSTPPFRSISPTININQLIGNTTKNQLGEIKLAQHGILFVDELCLFKNNILSLIASNLEDNFQSACLTKPSIFQLIGATNPCPCGYYGTKIKNCSCSLWQRERYQQKLSGAFLDRIDLFVVVDESVGGVWHNSFQKKHDQNKIKDQIINAYEKRKMRLSYHSFAKTSEDSIINNTSQSLSSNCWKTLEKAKITLKLSNRGLLKTIKVARTIADLDDLDDIQEEHLLEALSYRRK